MHIVGKVLKDMKRIFEELGLKLKSLIVLLTYLHKYVHMYIGGHNNLATAFASCPYFSRASSNRFCQVAIGSPALGPSIYY